MTVLIVGAEPNEAEILGDAFRKVGEDAEIARDGRAAAKRASEHHYDLLITDLLMPEFDGLELIRAVKRLHPETRIIAVSGGGYFKVEQLLDVACKLGADMALAKPFDPSVLVQYARRLRAQARMDTYNQDDVACWQ